MATHQITHHTLGSPVPPGTDPASRKLTRRRRDLATLQAELEIPFDPAFIQWRAMDFQTRGGRRFGLCMPYADPRVYRNRLDTLIGPKYWKDTLAVSSHPPKIIVTCELTIAGLGTKSNVGEDWLNNQNAATSAQAQAFKRACSCFGLGRYLYSFPGQWLELDEQMRPLTPPQLEPWATPEGWMRGLRPQPLPLKPVSPPLPVPVANQQGNSNRPFRSTLQNVIPQILKLEADLGRSMYRGLLKTVARVWDPTEIRQMTLQHRVLAHMLGAKRGLERYHAAAGKLSAPLLKEILQSCDVRAIEDVGDMETLRVVVEALESAVGKNQNHVQQ